MRLASTVDTLRSDVLDFLFMSVEQDLLALHSRQPGSSSQVGMLPRTDIHLLIR